MAIAVAEFSMHDNFLADVRDHPADPAPKLVLADWLEERDLTDLAFAYRWAGRRKRHPDVTEARRYYSWGTLLQGRRGGGQRKPVYPHQLPPLIFGLLRPVRNRKSGRMRYRTLPDAFEALADALQRLRDAVAC